VAGVVFEEIEQRTRLATRSAQVQVGNENGPKTGPFTTLTRAIVITAAVGVPRPAWTLSWRQTALESPATQYVEGGSHQATRKYLR